MSRSPSLELLRMLDCSNEGWIAPHYGQLGVELQGPVANNLQHQPPVVDKLLLQVLPHARLQEYLANALNRRGLPALLDDVLQSRIFGRLDPL